MSTFDEGSADKIDPEFDPSTGTYRVEYHARLQPPSLVIPKAIATIAETAPSELPPLYEAIDTEALDRLFLPTRRSGHRSDGVTAFDYCDYTITVRSYGIIEIKL